MILSPVPSTIRKVCINQVSVSFSFTLASSSPVKKEKATKEDNICKTRQHGAALIVHENPVVMVCGADGGGPTFVLYTSTLINNRVSQKRSVTGILVDSKRNI